MSKIDNDSVANNAEKRIIHIGPGHFETYGERSADGYRGFHVQRLWQVMGAGTNETVIHLLPQAGNQSAVFRGYHDTDITNHYFSDMTIDLSGQPSQADVDAIILTSRNTIIERIKVIAPKHTIPHLVG